MKKLERNSEIMPLGNPLSSFTFFIIEIRLRTNNQNRNARTVRDAIATIKIPLIIHFLSIKKVMIVKTMQVIFVMKPKRNSHYLWEQHNMHQNCTFIPLRRVNIGWNERMVLIERGPRYAGICQIFSGDTGI